MVLVSFWYLSLQPVQDSHTYILRKFFHPRRHGPDLGSQSGIGQLVEYKRNFVQQDCYWTGLHFFHQIYLLGLSIPIWPVPVLQTKVLRGTRAIIVLARNCLSQFWIWYDTSNFSGTGYTCSDIDNLLYTMKEPVTCPGAPQLTRCHLITLAGGGPQCHVTCTCDITTSCDVMLVRGAGVAKYSAITVCDMVWDLPKIHTSQSELKCND